MNKKRLISLYISAFAVLGVLTFFVFKSEKQDLSPMEQALTLYKNGDYKQSMIFFAQADSFDIPEASFALGAMHFAGKGTKINIPKAMSYYRKAADLGYAPAMTTMALLYMNGEGVEKNTEKAVELAEKAAERNDTEAQMMLAGWYENGEEVDQDVSKAVEYYKKAAENGDPNAKMALAVIYKDGKGNVLPNEYTAKRWEDSLKQQRKLENLFQNRPADYVEKISQ